MISDRPPVPFPNRRVTRNTITVRNIFPGKIPGAGSDCNDKLIAGNDKSHEPEDSE
jgi:hypothetical protein